MDIREMMFEFLRPVALGTSVVLALIVLLGLRIPRRAKTAARPFPAASGSTSTCPPPKSASQLPVFCLIRLRALAI